MKKKGDMTNQKVTHYSLAQYSVFSIQYWLAIGLVLGQCRSLLLTVQIYDSFSKRKNPSCEVNLTLFTRPQNGMSCGDSCM